eukprot:UN26631
MADLKSKYKKLQQQNEEYRKKLAEETEPEKMVALCDTLAMLQHEHEESLSTILLLKTELGGYKEKVKEMDAILRKQGSHRDAQTSILHVGSDEHKKKIVSLEKEIEHLQNQYSDLQADMIKTIQSKDQAIEALEVNIASLTDNLKNRASLHDNLNQEKDQSKKLTVMRKLLKN